MKFPPPHRGWTSGRAMPSLRPNPYAARSTSNPAERHLSKRGNCSDDRSQLCSSRQTIRSRRKNCSGSRPHASSLPASFVQINPSNRFCGARWEQRLPVATARCVMAITDALARMCYRTTENIISGERRLMRRIMIPGAAAGGLTLPRFRPQGPRPRLLVHRLENA